MPDSTTLPLYPVFSRASHQRTREERPRLINDTAPGKARAGAEGVTRPHPSPAAPFGPTNRSEQQGPRWRDIQWVDFTSDTDNANEQPTTLAPAPTPTASLIVPSLPMASTTAPRGATRPSAVAVRAMPAVGGVLRRFREALPRAGVRRRDSIPGLATRFAAVPVPRQPPAPSPKADAETMPVRAIKIEAIDSGSIKVGRIVAPVALVPPPAAVATGPMAARASQPRTSILPRPRVPPQVAAEPPPATEPVSAASVVTRPVETSEKTARGALSKAVERPFPASITTPVSREPLRERPPLGKRWRHPLIAAIGRLTNAHSRLGAPPHRKWRPDNQSLAARRGAVAAPVGRAVDIVAAYVGVYERRLRVSGLAALALILVAIASYGGGLLLTKLTSAPPPAAAPQKQEATPEPIAAPPLPSAPAASSSNVPTDPTARAAFYIVRAKAGDARAQYDLGVLYARGDGLVQDYASAASWFHAAAAQGNVAAEYNLGVLYAGGLGVPRNPTEAVNWYRSAADQNHPGAQFNLAIANAQGVGTKRDLAAAARWYQRAAQQGLGPAMVNLAILYEQGSGLSRSLIDAYAWYSAAGERGEPQVKRRADELLRHFNDSDKVRAEGLAATIKAALDGTTQPSIPVRPPA